MNVEKIFGTRVFDDSAMKKRLPEKTYQSLLRTRRLGQPLDPQIADVVAGMPNSLATSAILYLKSI